MRKQRTPKKYLNNRDLMAEVHESKKSYSWYADPAFSDYTVLATDLSEVAEPNVVYRIMNADHVPLCDIPKLRSRSPSLAGRLSVNFPPFKHYIVGETGTPIEVGRSHWKGDLETGEFSKDHGHMTPKLARMFTLLVEKYAGRWNWRSYSYNDEMQSTALVQLAQVGLQFDETRSVNPFAYFTRVMENCFTKHWNAEKRQHDIRDDLLMDAGAMPSTGRQMADLDNDRNGPVKVWSQDEVAAYVGASSHSVEAVTTRW